MKTVLTKTFGAALAIAGLAVALPAHATLVTYTVDGVAAQQFTGPVTPPANAPWGSDGYPGDTVALKSYTGSFDLVAGTSIQKINTLLWTIDYTYAGTATDPTAWSDLSFAFNAARNMTIDGVGPASLSQTGSLDVTWDNDYLGLAGGSTVTFYVQGYRVDVTSLAVAQTPGSNFDGSNPWVQPNQDIMAQFDISEVPVPEPTTMIAGALLLLPFGASTLRILRKSRAA
jgi:hypothetical protein